MANNKKRSDCPINYALEIFGDRWTLLIIRDLMFKKKNYFGDFLKSEEKIATNILTDRLVQLETAGIVTKITDPAHGSKVIYRLTDKGIDLAPVLTEIILWSAKHDPVSAVDQGFVSRAKESKYQLLAQIVAELK